MPSKYVDLADNPDEMLPPMLETRIEPADSQSLAEVCRNAIAAMDLEDGDDLVVLLLDAGVPEVNELEFVKSLEQRPHLVLVTGKNGAFRNVLHEEVAEYLQHPVHLEPKSEPPSSEASLKTRTSDHVFIKSNGRLVRIDLKNVLWIEAQSDYMMIVTSEGRYLTHSTMKKLVERLPASDFTRVHRSYIVRLDQITDIEDTTIVVEQKVIPIGASYKKDLLARLNTL